jgi:hypothetical protein
MRLTGTFFEFFAVMIAVLELYVSADNMENRQSVLTKRREW